MSRTTKFDPVAWSESQQITDEMKAAYLAMIADLQTIQTTANPTSAQVIWAIKKEAEIVEKLAKFIAQNLA
jgi:hypothetical protein